MGLFGFGKKKKEEDRTVLQNLTASPLGYWEEKSYMVVLPRKPYADLMEGIFERVEAIPEVKIKARKLPGEEAGILLLTYKDVPYEVGFRMADFQMPESMNLQSQVFTEEEMQEVQNADRALVLFMEFPGDSKTAYHLQLKLSCAMVPDMLAIMDESAEKMLCARWVSLAAKSTATPGPEALFIAQSVVGEKGEVWLHTHGLCRCGLSELEILCSNKEHVNEHYRVLSAFASMLLDKDSEFIPGQDYRIIGQLESGEPIVVTYLPWTEGLKEYPVNVLGGISDREDGHNSRTGLVFAYSSQENADSRIVTKITEFDERWGENPLFLFSNEETERMKSIAIERFGFVKKAFEEGTAEVILIKVGLLVDPGESGEQSDEHEHIWFELLGFTGEKFRAKLTQEPYNVSSMHEGDEGEYTVDDVTDWIIYTKEASIQPDRAYLLM